MPITIVGFLSSIGQVLILRELLVLFYGNELSTGLVFSGWLVWSAAGSGLGGYLGRRCRRPYETTAGGIALLALLLPATLLWIRAARRVWSIPLGEMTPPAKMLWIALSTTAPFCMCAGLLFSLAWAAYVRGNKSGQPGFPVSVYLCEAVGAAAGGILLYFALLPRIPVLWGASILSAAGLAAALLLLKPWRKPAMRSPLSALIAGLLLLGAAAHLLLPDPEEVSRRWQWGENVLAVHDTPYHNLAILRDGRQFTFFASGLWLFSVPDPQSAEQAVHLAMLEHPRPRSVLVLGGGIAGLVGEVLKHPDVTQVDYVEADPELIRLGEKVLPQPATAPLHDGRVHIFHKDASRFIRSAQTTYDVVLLNPGDPMNAEMNRFYTVELYRRVAKLLNPGGIVSFAVGAPTEIIGAAQARFLRSVHATLRNVFPQVLVYPGETARFFATDAGGSLTTDASEIVRRMRDRRIGLQYVRIDTLLDALSPMRLDYLASILGANLPARLNTDFAPTCYFNNLLLWSAQLHPAIQSVLLAAAAIDPLRFQAALTALVLLGAAFFWLGRPHAKTAAAVSVTVVGATLIVAEIVLLLGFQILEGFVYKQLAVIIALFMTGLAVGAAVYIRVSSRIVHPRLWIIAVQGFLALYLPALMHILSALQSRMQNGAEATTSLWIFAALALCAGIPGGMHFSLAVRMVGGDEAPSERVGGKLYALDTLGAAAAALAASIFLLPIFGVQATLHVFAILNLGSILALARPESAPGVRLLRLG